MQSAVGKERPEERRSYDENMTDAFMAYLKTIVLLGRPYGQGYLTRIVAGQTDWGYWKTPDPRDFETFGALALKEWDYLLLSIQLMVAHGLVEIQEPGCNTFAITPTGQKFLEKPWDIYEPKRNLRYSRYEKFLRKRLMDFRKARSESDHIAVWEVLPEFTIDRLTVEKPETVDALSDVHGMAYFRVQSFGAAILSVILESHDDFKVVEKERLSKLVKSPHYQNAKAALKRNANIPGVARELGCQVEKAFYYAETLATAGELNLKRWIEKQVDASTLYRGSEYFLKVKNPLLNEAFRTLGIDYDTLKLCRIYAQYVVPESTEAVPA